jgi:membrane fusion protein, multidrug efflux system
MKSKKKAACVALAALCVAAAIGVKLQGQSQPPQITSSVKSVEKPAEVEVQVARTEMRATPRYLLATGELKADKEASVAADASGKVVSTTLERGMTVEKGQVLFQLDDRTAKLNLRESQASLELAKCQYELACRDMERNKPLAEARAIAASDLQKFEADQKARAADLQLAQARLDMASKTLEDASIRAPFSGQIFDRLVEVGEYVRSDTAVAKLIDSRTLRLLINIPESLVGNIRQDQEVLFSVSAYSGKEFSGKVRHISPSVRNATRDMPVEVIVDNAGGELRPGFFVSAKVRLSDVQSLSIPKSAVRTQGTGGKVYVVQDKKIVEKLVVLGERTDAWVEIKQGLSEKDEVVISPSSDVADGVLVAMKHSR